MTNASMPTLRADELTLEVAAEDAGTACRGQLRCIRLLRFTRSECNTGHIVAKLQAAISCTHLKKSCQVVA